MFQNSVHFYEIQCATTSLNKAVNWDLGKLAAFLQKAPKRPPAYPNPLQRRYAVKTGKDHWII